MKMESKIFEASHFTRILWLEAMKLRAAEQSRYHIVKVYHYLKKPNIKSLRRAVQLITANNYNLRSYFVESKGKIKQNILNHLPVSLKLLQAHSKEEFKTKLNQLIEKPFNLAKPPLFRIVLIENITEKNYTLVLCFHHIIVDGLEIENIINEIQNFYHNPASSNKTDEDEIFLLSQYLEWEKKQIISVKSQEILNEVKKYPLNINLPSEKYLNNPVSFQQFYRLFSLPDSNFKLLKNFSKTYRVSIFNLLKILFAVLISKYSNQSDLCILYPYNTKGKSFAKIKGSFINSLLYLFNGDLNLLQLINNNASNQAIITNRFSPIDEILVQLNHPSFNISITPNRLCCDGIFLEEKPTVSIVPSLADSNLLLRYEENQDNIVYTFEWIAGFVSADLINQLNVHFNRLISIYLLNPNIPADRINFLTEQEYFQIIYQWNRTDKDYPRDKTLIQLFEEQVAKSPDSIALKNASETLSYQLLNAKANQLARYLRAYYKEEIGQELNSDTLIPICLNCSFEMIIAILAVMKAGGAYVPIDPEYPVERIQYLLEDTKANVIISNSKLKKLSSLPSASDYHLILIDQNRKLISTMVTTNLESLAIPESLAYVIYTSGSTGKPKGVMIPHHAIVNTIYFQGQSLSLNHSASVLLLSSFSFDTSLLEIFGSLIYGGKLVVKSGDELLAGETLTATLLNEKINVLITTPSVLNSTKLITPNNLRSINVGGESCSKLLIDKFARDYRFTNSYGPTETSIDACMWIGTVDADRVLIGKPIPNVKLYVLNKNLQPVPIYAPGELYIGGAGLARGYWHRPELTKERFIANPFATEVDIEKGYTRLYKTGDIVRWLGDGNLEYLGRNDWQVKMHGYRIELGEIENALNQYPGIEQSVVIARENLGNQFLAAYYSGKTEIESERLIQFLGQGLPQYMIPSIFTHLVELPLTTHGKIDREALPEAKFKSEANYVGPSDGMEAKIVEIWQQLLNLEKIGIKDDFFRLGGNSILAIQLSYRMSETLKLPISISDIFKRRTIENLLKIEKKGHSYNDIKPCKSTKEILSFGQAQLWFLDQYEQGSKAYNIPIMFQLDNKNIFDFKQSINSIISRHEVLRSVIYENDNGEFYQEVLQNPLTFFESAIEEKEIVTYLKKNVYSTFQLRQEYPIKVWIYYTENHIYSLVLFHHIAFDGWSYHIFLDELNQFYNHFNQGQTVNLKDLRIQYKDFALWQRSFLIKNLEKEVTYWQTKLRDFEPLTITTDQVRAKIFDYEGDEISFNLGKKLSFKIRNAAKKNGVSLTTFLLTGFYLVLHQYSGQNDLIIGLPAANRHYQAIENLIGFFVNSLAVRLQFSSQETVIDLIQKVHQNLLEAQENQDVPFEKVIEALKIEKDTSRNPLFQVMFSTKISDDVLNNQFQILPDYFYKIAKFDLDLLIDDSQEILTGTLTYATSLFQKETIQGLIESYRTTLTKMIKTPEAMLTSFNTLSSKEYEKIIYQWNRTDKDYPRDKTLIQLFEEQVAKSPDSIALKNASETLSYQLLNAKANQLARYLRAYYKEEIGQELNSDTLIPICLNRSFEMIIAILAVMKAGGAYVPIDPEYPVERIQYLLEDTKADIIISNSKLKKLSSLPPASDYHLILIDQNRKLISTMVTTNLESLVSSKNLAYVIYTSGSTGKPKGVMIPHQSIINSVITQIEGYQFDSSCHVLQFSSCSFDNSVLEIFCTLLSGGKLIITLPDELLPGEDLSRTLIHNKINLLIITPSALAITPFKNYKDLHSIIVGAEICPKILMKTWAKRYHFINAYGPTETSVDACMWICAVDADRVLIGKPIPNVKFYVLNKNLQPVPIYAPGELYIGGAGLAQGYWHRPELTKERFIANPFATEADIEKGYTRLYKTGDIVRWLGDGNLEYLGRNDWQVKMHGYRIELGEIENALNQYPGIEQSVVIARENLGNQFLAAYYSGKTEIESERLIQFLGQGLPQYMIPSIFTHLAELPLTTHGKIDREALPEAKFKSEANYVGPSDGMEAKIVEIWQQLLNLEKIGIKDDFFHLGGDSILSIQATFKMRKAGLEVNVKQLFELRTIEKLVKAGGQLKNEIIAEQGLLTGDFSLLPIQSWFFEEAFVNPHYWNQTFLIKVPMLEIKKLESSIARLAKHHDMLRLNFRMKKGEYQQYYQKNLQILPLKRLNRLHLKEEALVNILTDWQRRFDMSKGPLWQIGYIYGYEDQSARLFLAFHHLIIDTVSWRILVDHLQKLYEGKELGDKTSSYRQWVEAIESYAKEHEEEAQFWQANNGSSVIDDSLLSNEEISKCITFDTKLTENLIKKVNLAYHTEINDILLTVLGHALKDALGIAEPIITLESHGREAINDQLDLSQTVGWFTTMYPVRLPVRDNLLESLKNIMSTLRQIPNKGLGFLALKYLHSKPLAKIDLSPIIFNYLGQFSWGESDWQIVDEVSGLMSDAENRPFDLLSINGGIFNGQLKFFIDSRLNLDVTEKFIIAFENYLKEMIRQCVENLDNVSLEFNLITNLAFEGNLKQDILTVNPEGETPLIILPPGDGGNESYLRTLCPQLPAHIQKILIDNYLLKNGNGRNFANFHELALFYIEMLKTNHILQNLPSQKCFLAGWSMGAVLAYEISIELAKIGIEVLDNFLIEPFVPRLLDLETYDSEDFYKDYVPANTDKHLTIFRCLQSDPELNFTEEMIKKPFLGFDKVSLNYTEHLLECTHMSVLSNEDSLKKIADVIVDSIKNKSLEKVKKNFKPAA